LNAGHVNPHQTRAAFWPTTAADLANALAAYGRGVDSAAQSLGNEERPMDFTLSSRQKEWLERVQAFMKTHVRPAVPIYDKQDAEGPRWKVIPILEDLKKKAKAEGLWNMFMPPSSHEDDEFHGAD